MEIKIIKADDSKVFRRKSDGRIYGKEISLGFTYYINGKKLKVPRMESIEDFEQINEPEKIVKKAPKERISIEFIKNAAKERLMKRSKEGK